MAGNVSNRLRQSLRELESAAGAMQAADTIDLPLQEAVARHASRAAELQDLVALARRVASLEREVSRLTALVDELQAGAP